MGGRVVAVAPAQLGLEPLQIAGIAFVLLMLISALGIAYTQGMLSGILSSIPSRPSGSTETETEETTEDTTNSIAGGQPFEASESAGKVTPSGRQPGGRTKVQVRGTRKVGPLGTLIKVEVKNGELNVGDTVNFDEAGIEGRIGKIERDGQNVETASDGDVISFSLVGVDEVSVEEGSIGEKARQ